MLSAGRVDVDSAGATFTVKYLPSTEEGFRWDC
jgi:hypothetical protein